MAAKDNSHCAVKIVRSKAPVRMKFVFAVSLVLLIACEPSDRTPGLWLSGNTINTYPSDWTFTDSHREIFVQVSTPYFLPHSVTIWCAQANGDLYIAARDPESKNWVGWIGNDNQISLKIGEDVYDVAAQELTDEKMVSVAALAYKEKYDLGASSGGSNSTLKYWMITPQS